MKLLDNLKSRHHTHKETTLSMQEFLAEVKKDPSIVAGPAERLLKAIGKPKEIQTSSDRRLLRLFGNTTIRQYKPFANIFGMERTIEKIVDFLRHASQNLEESRQVLYLRGPVGSAKSTIVELLKKLMESEAIYVLAVEREDGTVERSPIHESPLGLFAKEDAKALGIEAHRLNEQISPWARKRLDEMDGDASKFKVIRTFPNRSREVAIAKVEPGDDNNNDISTLVGKTNIRKLAKFDQMDPDAYSYSGGLCKANQGCLDFVELNKSPLQMLNPLLTASQEGNYNPTEGIGSIPFEGLVLAHSNDTEWQKFKSDKRNEAFIDRFYVIDVLYNLRMDEEQEIAKHFLSRSTLDKAKIAPHTLGILGSFIVASRLEANSDNLMTKMKVYNGEGIKEKDPNAKTLEEYQLNKSDSEGFVGISTRDSFKILADVFDKETTEVAADPVNLFKSIKQYIDRPDSDHNKEELSAIREALMIRYHKLVSEDVQTAYLDTGDDFCQAEFERYITYAQHYIEKQDYRDPETDELISLEQLEKELAKIEDPAGIRNTDGFRYEAAHFAMKIQIDTGTMPRWNSYAKLAKIIKDRMRVNLESMLPVISFSKKRTSSQDQKHNEFVKRMTKLGYTKRQVRRVVEWQLMFKNS